MAITYVASATTTYAARANTSVGVPAGTTNGDFLVLGIISGGAEAIDPTAPAGWTAIGATPISDIAAGGFNVEMRLYSRVASSEPGSYAFTHASASTQGWMLCYRGVDNTTPFDTTQTVNFVNGTGNGVATATWTGLTTVTANAWIVAIEHDWGDVGAASTPPTGMTERIDIDIVYVADQNIAAAGATGNRTHVTSSTSPDSLWSAVLLALRPAGGATQHAVSGTVVSSSAITGEATAKLGTTGTNASTSVAIGGATARFGGSGTVVAISTVSGTARARFPDSGTVVASSATTGTAVMQANAAGVTSTTSTVSGTITVVPKPVSGTVVIGSTASGTTKLVAPVAGAAGVVSTVSGTLSDPPSGSSGVVVISSAVTGTPTATHPLAGVAASTSTMAGTVAVKRLVTGLTATQSTVSGQVVAYRPMTGVVTSTSVITGAAKLLAGVAGGVDVVSNSTGTLFALMQGDGTVSIVSAAYGHITIVGVVPAYVMYHMGQEVRIYRNGIEVSLL